MAHVRGLTTRVDIPNEDGAHATIKKLNWKQLERAREVRSDKGAANMRSMGGDIVKAFREIATVPTPATKTEGQAAPAKRDRSNTYDVETVLRDGVVSLSYFEKFKADDVLDLDEQTARFLFDSILNYAGVPEVDGQAEADRKNG